MVEDGPNLPTAPPDLDVLDRMPVAHWSGLLPHLRSALQAVADEALTPALRRLRAAPTKRLRDGRVRRDLQRALADGGALWVAFRERLAEDAAAVGRWREALAADEQPVSRHEMPGTDEDLVTRLKERARALRRERDELQRQVDGANARAAAAEQARDDAVAVAARLERELEQADGRLEAAREAERSAEERAGRRRDREVAELQEELRLARRALDEARREVADARDALARAQDATTAAIDVDPVEVTRVVPGRPSQVPGDLVPGTTDYARALLPRGRIAIVDGYNVTRTHRADLSLSDQRDWLVGLLSAAASRYGIDITVVFDGADGGGVGSQRTRGIHVEFSRAGMSADDDICFVVAALPDDVPVTVVTDDRGLRERLAPERVDVLHTREFLWAVD